MKDQQVDDVSEAKAQDGQFTKGSDYIYMFSSRKKVEIFLIQLDYCDIVFEIMNSF